MKATKIVGTIAALLFACGCVDNYVTLEVMGAKPFELEPSGEPGLYFCVTPSPGGDRQRAQGWMDTETGCLNPPCLSFMQPFEFRNNLPNNADPSAGRLDSNAVTLEQVEVTYRGLPGQDDVDRAVEGFATAIPMTGVVESAGGRLVAPVPLIPANRGQAIRDTLLAPDAEIGTNPLTLIATLQLRGRTNAGARIETGEIDFPITIGRDTNLCDDGRCACYNQ